LFWTIPEFEFKASRFLGKCSTTWVIQPTLFCARYFWEQDLSTTCPG
jgi:hypothetical protein